jgi:hypothetical protein
MLQTSLSSRLLAAAFLVAGLLAPRVGSAQSQPTPAPPPPAAPRPPQPTANPPTDAATAPGGTGVTEQPVTGPGGGPASVTVRATDAPVGKKVPPREPEHVQTLNIEGLIGGATRLSDSATGGHFTERGGLSYQLGLSWSPTARLSVGAAYFHTGAGVEEGQNASGLNSNQTTRWVDAAMLELRVFPFRGETVRLFLGILGGVGFEGVDQRGSTVSQAFAQPQIDTFGCSAHGGAGLGLGGSLGMDVDMGGGASLLVRAAALAFALPSKALTDGNTPCTTGGGTTSSFQGQIGLQYRFDLAPRPAPAVAPAATTAAAH